MLAIGLFLLIIRACLPPPADNYAAIAGGILIVLYGILLAIYYALSFFGICKGERCEVEKVHVIVLGILMIIVGILSLIPPVLACMNGLLISIAGGYLGIWGIRLERCLNG